MKLGKFQDLLDKRFTKEELAELDREVELEVAALRALQQNEIEGTEKMNKIFEGLKDGLEEAIAHQQGKINLRTESIEIPEPPKMYKAKANRTKH